MRLIGSHALVIRASAGKGLVASPACDGENCLPRKARINGCSLRQAGALVFQIALDLRRNIYSPGVRRFSLLLRPCHEVAARHAATDRGRWMARVVPVCLRWLPLFEGRNSAKGEASHAEGVQVQVVYRIGRYAPAQLVPIQVQTLQLGEPAQLRRYLPG